MAVLTSAKTVRAILAYGALVMLFYAFTIILKSTIDATIRDVVMVMVGAIITNAKDAISFFFATSQTSIEKTDLLHSSKAAADNVPEEDQ